MQGLLVMTGTMIALGMWLFVIGVSPAVTYPGKFRLFLTMAFGFILAVAGFLIFAFASELGSHLAAINMMLFGVASLQYTFRTIDQYSVARESVAPALQDCDDYPLHNIDGTPMIEGTMFDCMGNAYGFPDTASVFDD